MSQENVELIRKMGLAFQTEDARTAWTFAQGVLDPQMEMDMTRLPAPGLARVYVGLEEIAGFWLEWLDAWGSIGEVEGFEVRDGGDQVVFWSTRQTMRGKGSGKAVDLPEFAWTATVRDSKIVRATLFMSKDEALEAAGLSG